MVTGNAHKTSFGKTASPKITAELQLPADEVYHVSEV